MEYLFKKNSLISYFLKDGRLIDKSAAVELSKMQSDDTAGGGGGEAGPAIEDPKGKRTPPTNVGFFATTLAKVIKSFEELKTGPQGRKRAYRLYKLTKDLSNDNDLYLLLFLMVADGNLKNTKLSQELYKQLKTISQNPRAELRSIMKSKGITDRVSGRSYDDRIIAMLNDVKKPYDPSIAKDRDLFPEQYPYQPPKTPFI